MTNMTRRAAIIGTGSYLSERIASNEELARSVATSDYWVPMTFVLDGLILHYGEMVKSAS